jgi:pyruvate dehydrogenase E2 component (dihydrolipoamide acetyltransferase)
MADIVMPRLSDTMEEGTILRWLKRDGDHVRRGEELVEIETDKASMTYESDQEGVVELVAGEGDTLAIGELIARVAVATGDGEAPSTIAPNADAPRVSGADGPARAGDHKQAAAPEPSRAPAAERVKASPLAKRMAADAGLALAGLAGSGPGGRIVKADVEAARRDAGAAVAAQHPGAPAAPQRAAAAAPALADVMTAKGEARSHELSRTQQQIARRMAESKATIPHFTLQTDVDMEECVALRSTLADAAGAQSTVPTYNDMVVKACALALREHPRVNASYGDGRVQVYSRVNVGVAVAVEPDDPLQAALVVPTIFDADIKSLGEIARETRALAERVRTGTITPPELSGGTFTVSNLGMYGVRSFAAIINPPQAAILSVGALGARAVVRSGEIVARNTMAVTLACDHRVLYGADAARFQARVRELLENSASLTL